MKTTTSNTLKKTQKIAATKGSGSTSQGAKVTRGTDLRAGK